MKQVYSNASACSGEDGFLFCRNLTTDCGVIVVNPETRKALMLNVPGASEVLSPPQITELDRLRNSPGALIAYIVEGDNSLRQETLESCFKGMGIETHLLKVPTNNQKWNVTFDPRHWHVAVTDNKTKILFDEALENSSSPRKTALDKKSGPYAVLAKLSGP